MDIILKLLENLFSIYNESAFYLVLGLIFAGLSHRYLAADFIKKHLSGSSIWTNIKASIVGTPVPLCSCGVVPVGLELKKKGLSKSATASFLIATPENGVDSILLTQGFFGTTFTVLRVAFSILLANIVGLFVGIADKQAIAANDASSKENSEEGSVSCCASHGHSHGHSHDHNHSHGEENKDGLGYILDTFLPDLVPWLLIGFILSAAITTFIPTEWFQSLSSESSVMAAALIGIPLYVCASASTPIAYSLLLNGLSPGAVFVFLLTGPATNSANVPLYVKELGLRQTLAFYISLFIGSISIGLLINYFGLDLSSHLNAHAHEHESGSILEILGTLVFTALIAWSYYRKYQRNKPEKKSCCS